MRSPDYSKIPFPTIPKLFRKQGISSPAELIPVCFDGNRGDYQQQDLSFFIDHPIQKVWKAYVHYHPDIIWNTRMVSFAALYDRKVDKLVYPGDQYKGLSKGQVYLVNLRIFPPFLQIAVAHEIEEVNEKEKTIKICYLNSGKTEGSQWIIFKPSENGTQIVHKTLYKGTNFVRDRILYPFFHAKAMRQFHGNIKDLLHQEGVI